MKNIGALTSEADETVAARAEEAANLAGLSVVIDGEASPVRLLAATDRAETALAFEQLLVRNPGDAELPP